MIAMARNRGTTTERGLGANHIADRKRLLAQLRDGEPCWRCGQPMYKWQDLDRDHVIDRALGGTDGAAVLAHKSCNRSAGAALGNRLRSGGPMLAAGSDTICATCGKPYHYAARICEVCQAHYHPSGKAVRTCGRPCGVELRRRIYGTAGSKAAKPVPPCLTCGKPPPAGRKYCSDDCADAALAARVDERQAQKAPATPISYYTCLGCGKLGINGGCGTPREWCPARECQLARLARNNLIARKGMTREQANAAILAYRAEGDHRQMFSGRRSAIGRRPARPVAGYDQARLW